MGEISDLEVQVQGWVEDHWDEALTVREWWRLLFDAGYSRPTWPRHVGGLDASVGDARRIHRVLGATGVVGPPTGNVAAALAAPTILDHGTSEQVSTLVRDIALGEAAWCQLFSEPGAGSDLASVATSAGLDGDEWVVSGQKVWNSGADTAELGMLVARTDRDRPKHRGITYFAIPMRQAGIEARPLRQMNGQSTFCEVFLTDARIPAANVIGDLNDGWAVTQTTLRHERAGTAGGAIPGLVPARSGTAGDLDVPCGELVERARRARVGRSALRGSAVPVRAMIDLAREHGRADDPLLRGELARYHAQVKANGWTAQRIAAAKGALTGADGSVAKLLTSRVCQTSRDLSYRIVGAHGLLAGPESPMAGDLQIVNLGSPSARLGGGTDEVQLNVVGERALGLPREPDPSREVPFCELGGRWSR